MNKQHLRLFWGALKGINMLGELEVRSMFTRQHLWKMFNEENIPCNDNAIEHAKDILKEHDILSDYQLLTELLN